jgi:DNA repair exonuclease SbcCD ATPase subunit
MAGRAAYAQAIRVKPIADTMRAAGVMIGRVREAISRTLDRVQSRLEDRMARARRILTRDQAGLETWRGLERDFERFTALDGAYREAESGFAKALEYYDENPGDTLAGVALFLAREEYERLKAEREAERKRLEAKIRHLREHNEITGDDYRALMTGVREVGAVPATALQYAKKRVKDYEEQVDVDRAQLMGEEAVDKPLIGIVRGVREAPKKAWQELRRRVSEGFEIRGPRGQE